MQQFMTIFDRYPSSWQAAYTAFDVAARLSARLIGGFIVEELGPDRATELMQEFETGARAARIEHESLLLSGWPDLYRDGGFPINGLFVGKPFPAGWQGSKPVIHQLIEEFSFPVWIVPQKRPVRKIVALIEDAAKDSGPVHFGRFLERRLNQSVRCLALSGPNNGPFASKNTSFLSPPYDVEHLMIALAAENADLVLLGRPGGQIPVWEICCKTACLAVVCPPEG